MICKKRRRVAEDFSGGGQKEPRSAVGEKNVRMKSMLGVMGELVKKRQGK